MKLIEFYKVQRAWTSENWEAYEKRVRELETEGLTTSEAQGVADVEFCKNN